MIELLKLHPCSFGLDITDFSIKAAQLKKRGKALRLASWGEIMLPPGLIQEGEIQDIPRVAAFLQQLLSQMQGEKIRTKNVIASLPETKAFAQVIQMPRMAPQELQKAVPFEAENYIPLPLKDMYLDFQTVQPLRNHLDHTDVLLAALPRKTVDPYVKCLKKAGLTPHALEIEPAALARAVIKNETTTTGVLVLDIGRSNTNFVIFAGRSLRFTAMIPVSSHTLTKAIARNLKIDEQEAETLKVRYGLKAPKRYS